MTYETGQACPDCGVPEGWTTTPNFPGASLAETTIAYSCVHFQKRTELSPCRFCGKPHTPVRQVPVPIPVSECYCDDCVERCAEHYAGVFEESQRQ